MKQAKWKAFICAFLCTSLLLAGQPAQVSARIGDASSEDDGGLAQERELDDDEEESREQISDLNSQYKTLEDQKKQIDQKIVGVQSDKKQKSAEMAVIQEKIDVTKQQISVLNEKITYLDGEIAAREKDIENKQGEIGVKEGEIEAKEADIQKNISLMKQRIRADYMAGSPSLLSVLFGSDDFYHMLTNAEMMSRIVEHDDKLVNKLREEKQEIEDAKAELETQKADLESQKDALETDKTDNESAKQEVAKQQQELAEEEKKISSQVQTLADMEREFYANQAAVMKDMQETQAAIQRIYEEINNKSRGEFVGGDWGWPLPGYEIGAGGMITSEFGSRFGGSDYHTGMDISGGSVFGKNIVASNEGTVAFVQTQYTAGKGYGIHVIIDHGGGYTTLYAHMSAVSVSVGQEVRRGQTIGQVGSTGWSTGPHLHFEVRINGTAQNPRGYLF